MFASLIDRHPARRDQAGSVFALAHARSKQDSTVSPIQRAAESQKQKSDVTLLVHRSFVFGHDFGRVSVHDPPGAANAGPRVSEPGDQHEQEADRAAEQVMRVEDPGETRDGVSHVPNEGGGFAPHGAGEALDPEARRFFEPRFGYSFADVRVHADESAGKSARELRARAYTIGRDIAFAPGEYQPESTAGRRLLAHELAHVVQKTRTPGQSHIGPAAATLSRAPAGQVQRKLIATGSTADFATMANAVIGVQQEIVISASGEVTLRSTSVQGPLTSAGQELISVLQTAINDAKTTTIEFIHGATSTRASDALVIGGNYRLSRVDLDDAAAFGVSVGRGPSAGTVLAHEIQEQYRKQVHSEDFPTAHVSGLASEARAAGATITPGNLTQVNATTIRFTDTYTYPDGKKEEVTVTVTNGNITNVTRRTLP